MPTNIVISRATIQVSMVRALRHSTGLNAGTALETASTPVIAVAPEEKARSTSRAFTASVVGSRGGGSGWKPRPAAATSLAVMSAKIAMMKA